jgi:salicylate hydroxylase
MGIEDSAIMAELLAEVQRRLQSTAPDGSGLTAADALEVAFQTFDACRRERTQWLVQNSRICGEIYQWRFPPSGNDMEKCKEELEWRARRVWDVDVDGMVKDAVKQLGKSLEERKMGVRLAKL